MEQSNQLRASAEVGDGTMVFRQTAAANINITSTCDCGLPAGLACEYVRTLVFAGTKIAE